MPRNIFQGMGKKEVKPPVIPVINRKEDLKKKKTLRSTDQEARGLLVTSELEKAIAECKAKVDAIARNCQANNKKFRFISIIGKLARDLTCLQGYRVRY